MKTPRPRHPLLTKLIQALLAEVYRAPAAALPESVRNARARVIVEADKVVQQGHAQKAA